MRSATLFIILCIFLIPIAQAHAPLKPGENEDIDTASLIPDPTKSWAIYSELHEGEEAQYYRFDIEEGQRIHITLFIPAKPAERGFLPGFVLMGPGISTQNETPDFVEVPAGAGTLAIEGQMPDQAIYEPFSPSSFYQLADLRLDAPASGTYYIAVYDPSRGGNYGLAVGDREDFTLLEWILIPINQISIYQWEGQSLGFIFAPMIAVVVIGLLLMIWRRGDRSIHDLFYWVGSIAGLFFLGTGATVITQIAYNLARVPLGPEIVVTLLLAVIPILLGIVTLRIASGRVDVRRRALLFILGVIAIFAWAGLLVGPALAMIASILPSRTGLRA